MQKKIIVSLISIIILTIPLFILVQNNLENSDEIIAKESLITYQSNLEEKFKIDGYTIDNPNIILDPYDASPLTALVLFETNDEVEPTITIVGKDELTTYTYKSKKSNMHYLPIYGLYADYENTIIIEYEDVRKEITIKTNPLPDNFILPTSIKADKEKLSNDLYFFTPSSRGYTCAYDTNGDVRWYLTNYAIWNINKLKNGHMLVSTERLINAPYYMTGLYEIDMFGKIYNEYSLEGGYHHDYYEMPNGNLLVASDNFNSDEGTVEDYIVEIDRQNGNIVKKFDLKSILNMEDGKSENWSSYDWFHNNAVWYDDKTNSITLSGRHQDAVINISYETGNLNWIIGDSTNWSSEYQEYFFKPVGDNFEWQWSQHAAMITPKGYVFLFDNGNNKSKIKENYVSAENSYSRGVMYKIDTNNMTIEQIYEYGKERGSEFYSPYISDVDYLDENHYIIHSGGIVYVDGKNSNQPAGLGGADKLVSDTVEILNDEIIFEIVLPTNNYRVEKMNFYDNVSYELGSAKRLGSLGTTKTTKVKKGFILNSKKINEEYNSHNISFNLEEDRLVFNGLFKKGTNVNIILYKDMNLNIYKVPISKKPYTALCVDIFTEEENEKGITVTKYINKEGLKGKYKIYLEVDGTVYNTNKYINI